MSKIDNPSESQSLNPAKQESEDAQGLVYPCEFPLKMFGKNELHFIAAVEAVVEQWVPRSDWASSKQTASKNNTYVSYEIVIIARDRTQLDGVCAAVTACPAVIMAL
jgi:putative lipoic acid-binding regulatory protein